MFVCRLSSSVPMFLKQNGKTICELEACAVPRRCNRLLHFFFVSTCMYLTVRGLPSSSGREPFRKDKMSCVFRCIFKNADPNLVTESMTLQSMKVTSNLRVR